MTKRVESRTIPWNDDEFIRVNGIPHAYQVGKNGELLVMPYTGWTVKTTRWKTDVTGRRTPEETKLAPVTGPLSLSVLTAAGFEIELPVRLRTRAD